MEVMLILNVVFIIFGLYLVAMATKMKKTGTIHNMVMSQEERVRCKDEKGYIAFVTPKMVIFGTTISLVGVLEIVSQITKLFLRYRFVILIMFLIMFAVYQIQMREAKNKFF